MNPTFKIGDTVEVSLGKPVNHQVSYLVGKVVGVAAERGYYRVQSGAHQYLFNESMMKAV